MLWRQLASAAFTGAQRQVGRLRNQRVHGRFMLGADAGVPFPIPAPVHPQGAELFLDLDEARQWNAMVSAIGLQLGQQVIDDRQPPLTNLQPPLGKGTFGIVLDEALNLRCASGLHRVEGHFKGTHGSGDPKEPAHAALARRASGQQKPRAAAR